jgi:3'-phosphoadenosine 5'-phosphosulfate sulfotransferase (PAPS reductase)/FAD synthetase
MSVATERKFNPYFINEPAAISFSGGRTSAYMLYKVLEAHQGSLPKNVKVIFANTGKEMPETLDFVKACSDHWGVEIIWLELSAMQREKKPDKRAVITTEYRVVNHQTASRNGEPFKILLDAIPAMPNVVGRYCTAELKIRPMTKYLTDLGFELPVLTLVGIRYDEQYRASKINGTTSHGQEKYLPLWVDEVDVRVISDFWSSNNFDLGLQGHNGDTAWSNCDLCFMKSKSRRLSIMKERPDLSTWWINAEKLKGSQFRREEPSYEQMQIIATDQGQLFDFDDDPSIPCFCGD